MPISIIFVSNFPKNLKFKSNNLFKVFESKDDNAAFETLDENINNNRLYNIILSGHKTIEEAYGLLKSFLDYNIENGFCFDNSNYPFFMFIENENLNKKKLYAYYIEMEKKRELKLKEGYKIDSKIIIFSNLSVSVKDKLNNIINYYHRKDVNTNQNKYYSPYIKFMYIGVTGTGKSTMINEFNGEKLSYSSSENHIKTRINEKRKLLFKNRKYPILNQDTEGFEIGDNTQINQVNNNINKNEGFDIQERLHIVIYLIKKERGLDNNDIPLLAKLHKMKILYYVVDPKNEDMNVLYQGKARRVILSLLKKIDQKDPETQKLFKDFTNTEIKTILNDIFKKLPEIFFSANILSVENKGKILLLEQIKKDLLKIYDIHQKFIETIESLNTNIEKAKINISGEMTLKEDKNYIKMVDDSPFFYKFSIDDIKRKEAEKLLEDYDVSAAWLFFYNNRVKKFRENILQTIKSIYSDVKIETSIELDKYSENESLFYKTENTKKFIITLIDFYAQKYKEMTLNQKYYSLCKDYNISIKKFEQYVEDFKNSKLNEEPVRYDIDFI